MTGRIFAIKRFAVHDGDGIRTTVFLRAALCVAYGAIIPRVFHFCRSWLCMNINVLVAANVRVVPQRR